MTNRLLPLFAALLALVLALPPGASAQDGVAVPESAAQMQLSFAPVVQKTSPAVVSIYATRVVSNPFANDPFFSQFFEGMRSGAPTETQTALGSGVIVEGGLVVSNHHVVVGADDIRVILADRREFSGRVVLEDERADLAVIALDDATDLPVLPFADSDDLAVGDLVLAIGNPFGVGQTVSSGIISGLARSGSSGGGIDTEHYFIQTDAPINPGNSGGALVDMQGRLVGINTRIVTRSGGSNGIGFAIPSNLVAQVVAQAADGESRFQRPWSGLRAQVVTADLAPTLGLDRPRGILVRDLHPDSPFLAAGLEVGDIIVALDGDPVNTEGELEFRMATHPIGGSVSVEILHDGQPRQVQVVMQTPPGGDIANLARTIETPGPFQGLLVVPVTEFVAHELGLSSSDTGVLVLSADESRSRFRQGDLILSVNGQDLHTAEQLEEISAAAPRWWQVVFRRGERLITSRFNR